MTMFFTFKMKPCEKNNSLWQWLQRSNYKYISLTDLQIQILIFPTMSPDSETSEMPQTETTEPTQPEPQTPDQTEPNPPEKNSVTSKVRTLQKTSKNTLFVKLHPLCVWLRRSVFVLQGNVVCVDKIPVQYKYDVLLKLKASSTCVSIYPVILGQNLGK